MIKEKITYKIGMILVNEALFLYEQSGTFSSDVRICRCSLESAICDVMDAIEGEKNIEWVRVSFRGYNEFKDVYISAKQVMKQLRL